ncbi:hypothetical protein A2W67_01725 [Candidatus Nomurabacteria bacterium RIFCSPLOWO2_02_40_28]|nr:MAG: hypothetical protein A2W50_00775 [Candidatus Nomurabacteria bacterium RIFCSPHIGHO2_02_40_30]OGI79719.1 MAG: hypothetical protein A2W43_03305 [Candidatus Nomurabacteria bacterium RIFCSPHIGHO2_12_40_11]OGI82722.1 MAG: hypothetical protein A3E33_01620 [Candidatus Nomurabacteria bacterium RIFCSPHIGHO2_12_FULL_40_77]OGI96735.1 MAG: hypothetical protein A2W67_01725 [Candidatus Nomurabacteria bacterium RIFCSPLOWO2_02_40_28]OGI98525.1 MAG: hypothetical protein A2W78_01835 [Candidatus Nomurabact
MKKWHPFHKVLGALFLITGVIFYITPIPGTTLLIILGLVWLIGKNRTSYFFKEILGKKVFKFLRLGKLIKKID